RGDQIVHIQVETPGRLSEDERKLLQKLAELRGESLNLKKPETQEKPEGKEEQKKPDVQVKQEKTDSNGQQSKKGEKKKKGRDSKGKKKDSDNDSSSIMDKIADFFGAKDSSDES